MMIPAFDHGARPRAMLWPGAWPGWALATPSDSRPVIAATRTVRLPFPASGWPTR